MLTCREATRLMSDAQDRPLAAGERLQLLAHLAACRGCRRYREQLDWLRRAVRGYLAGIDRASGPDD